MGNGRWLGAQLRRHLQTGDKVLEIGAGDATLALRHFPQDIDYTGLDLAPRPDELLETWSWRQENILDADLDGDIVLANLFLHHFSDAELRAFGRRLSDSPARVVLVAEPHRHSVHQWQGRLLYPFGLSEVTRHDMQVSIAAGFRKGELAEVLGVTGKQWVREESRTKLGSLRMEASRNGVSWM